jgi:glycosyltransferase involved in cell wall biosynthesis
MEISIITPVYNAEKYLEHAVNSALQFSCVKEVILVEDASPDNVLEICKKLELKHSRVKLFTHPNNENKGAGASRNLAIRKAKSNFIAFLDADDWYLPNRFDAELELLKDTNIDGVYGATAFYYENEKRLDNEKITSFDNRIESNMLLYEILRPTGGRFTTDAITVKKSLLETTGLMNTSLRLHQDSELWLRLAYHGKLATGIIDKAVAVRRVHPENRITNSNRNSQNLYNKTVFNYFKRKRLKKIELALILKNYIISDTNSNYNIIRVLVGVKILIKNPKVFFKLLF